jgi:hypothetical protein
MLLVAVIGKVQNLVIYPFTVMTQIFACAYGACAYVCVCVCVYVCVCVRERDNTQFHVSWIKRVFQNSHAAYV